jgi:hypothetical protein
MRYGEYSTHNIKNGQQIIFQIHQVLIIYNNKAANEKSHLGEIQVKGPWFILILGRKTMLQYNLARTVYHLYCMICPIYIYVLDTFYGYVFASISCSPGNAA